MKVFATNYLEGMTDDVDGGNKWNWQPVDMPNKSTGPGRPTNTQTITRPGSPNQDENSDSDQPAETAGMLVA